MHEKFNTRVRRYPGAAAHDATGMGGRSTHDYLTVDAEAVVMVGRDRQKLLSDYVQAVEHGAITGLRIEYAYNEHRYATNDDLYRPGSKSHTPDSVVAGALALGAAGRSPLIDLNPDALAGPSVLDGIR